MRNPPVRGLIALVLLLSLAALAPGPAPSAGPAELKAAPEIMLPDLEGKTVDWKRFEGKVVLLDFWATWCQPCRRSMPEMQVLHDRWGPRGFTVVGVSVDQQGPANVQKFVATLKLANRIAIDARHDVAGRYGISALPTAYLVDGKGRIVKRWIGAPDKKDLERQLAILLPSPEALSTD